MQRCVVSGQSNAPQRGQYETGGIPSTGFGLAVMNFMGVQKSPVLLSMSL